MTILLVVCLAGAGVADDVLPVTLAPDGKSFRVGSEPWYPFGCNYFDPHVGWAPRLWERFDPEKVESHFEVMASLGVNAARVFLTAKTFFNDGEYVSPDAFEKFDKLLEIGRRHRIRIHPTGPDHWEGSPEWRQGDLFADRGRLDVQARFWTRFCSRYKDEPVIFAYDLLNEPHVGWKGPAMEGAWHAWLRARYSSLDALHGAWGLGEDRPQGFDDVPIPADAAAPESKVLRDFQDFRESLGDRWVQVQVDAIRRVDTNHLITVGLIQWSVPVLHGAPSRYSAFRPSRIAPLVDFLSVHFYPLHGDPLSGDEAFDNNLAYLEFVLRYVGAATRAPLVVGELGWYGGGTPERGVSRSEADQARWCEAAVLQGRGVASGWLNWAYADTPSSQDITKFSGLVTEDGKPKVWGQRFETLAREPHRWRQPPQLSAAREAFSVGPALVDPGAGNAALNQYVRSWRRTRSCLLEVRP